MSVQCFGAISGFAFSAFGLMISADGGGGGLGSDNPGVRFVGEHWGVLFWVSSMVK